MAMVVYRCAKCKAATAVTLVIPATVDAKKLLREWRMRSVAKDKTSLAGAVTLELAEFVEPGKSEIEARALRCHARNIGADLGVRAVAALLDAQLDIPRDWQKYVLVFPSVTVMDKNGFHYMLCFRYRPFRETLSGWPSHRRVTLPKWVASFRYCDLGVRWGARHRLLRVIPSPRASK